MRVTQEEDDGEEEVDHAQDGRGTGAKKKSRLDWTELNDIDEEEYEKMRKTTRTLGTTRTTRMKKMTRRTWTRTIWWIILGGASRRAQSSSQI